MGLCFVRRFVAVSVVVGACLAAVGTWLDDKPYTVERIALNVALLAGVTAIAIALPLAVKRLR